MILDLIEKTKQMNVGWQLYYNLSVKTTIDNFDFWIEKRHNGVAIKIDDEVVFEENFGVLWRSALGVNACKLRNLVEIEVKNYRANKKVDALRKNELIVKLAGL